MPLIRDRNMLYYNRDLHEIRRMQYGNGLTYNQMKHGDGLWDYAKQKLSQAKNYATKSTNTKSFAAKTLGSIGEAAGAVLGKKVGETAGDKLLSGLKTGLKHADSIKSSVDLVGHSVKTGLEIAKSAEDYKRSKLQTEAQEKLDDEFFRQLRIKSDELKNGRGITKRRTRSIQL
jgi:hypothetical protein